MPLYALSHEFRSEFNFKCLDSIIPAYKGGDTVVPSFTGEENKTEALRWLFLFTQWALQQGLSADHTLLLASTHINYSLIYQPQLPTWTEFIHDFFTYYDATPGQGERFVDWYIKKASSISLTWFSYRELKTATNNFSEHKLIGNGNKAYVFKGELCDSERNVAVKKLKDVTDQSLEHMLYEVFVHRSLSVSKRSSSSSRLVNLVGYSSYEQDPLLVYEYVSGANLQEYLQGLLGYKLTWDERLNIAIDTGDAIAQLHRNSKLPIYHLDVKSSNVLLDEKRRARLGDFGLASAVSLERSVSTDEEKGSRGYLDPFYESTGIATHVADVYSFGIVVMELVTGLMADNPNKSSRFLPELVVETVKQNQLDEIIDSDMVWDPSVCAHCMPAIALQVIKVALQCCSADPEKRPNICEATEQLRDVQLEQKIMAMEIDQLSMTRKHEVKSDKGVKFKCSGIVIKMDKKKRSPSCRRRRF